MVGRHRCRRDDVFVVTPAETPGDSTGSVGERLDIQHDPAAVVLVEDLQLDVVEEAGEAAGCRRRDQSLRR